MMEPFKTSIRIGMITMPQGSRWMCGMGFNVTCPPSDAVSSPPILAARACAASWQVVEKRKTTYQMNPRASCSGEKLGMKGGFVSPASSVDGAPQVCKGSEKRLKVRRSESVQRLTVDSRVLCEWGERSAFPFAPLCHPTDRHSERSEESLFSFNVQTFGALFRSAASTRPGQVKDSA